MAQILSPYTFTDQSTLVQQMTSNFTAQNQDFANTFINQYTLELVHKFPLLFSEKTWTLQTYPNQQYYTLPIDMRRVSTVVINVNNINGNGSTNPQNGFNWPVTEAPSQEFWNQINTVQNITSDIPLYYYVRNNGTTKELGIYPRPAAGYNPITIRGQVEITAVSQSDYSTGTIQSVPLALTLTTAPVVGDQILTLSSSWTLPSNTYQISFSDGEKILATLTNGTTLVALGHPIQGSPNYQVAFTTAPAFGDTSLTLAANWPLITGNYLITFSDGEQIVGTFTNGNTAITLATAIAGTETISPIAITQAEDGGNVSNITTAITVQSSTGGDIITGVGTTWTSQMVGRILRIAQPTGDAYPYVVSRVYSTTQLALETPYSGSVITAATATYSIGQTSIIPTAYQLIPVYRTIERYYRVIVKDDTLASAYGTDAQLLTAQLITDYGRRTTDPTIYDDDQLPIINPNLYISTTSNH